MRSVGSLWALHLSHSTPSKLHTNHTPQQASTFPRDEEVPSPTTAVVAPETKKNAWHACSRRQTRKKHLHHHPAYQLDPVGPPRELRVRREQREHVRRGCAQRLRNLVDPPVEGNHTAAGREHLSAGAHANSTQARRRGKIFESARALGASSSSACDDCAGSGCYPSSEHSLAPRTIVSMYVPPLAQKQAINLRPRNCRRHKPGGLKAAMAMYVDYSGPAACYPWSGTAVESVLRYARESTSSPPPGSRSGLFGSPSPPVATNSDFVASPSC